MTGNRNIYMSSGDYRETTVKDNATYIEGNCYSKQNLAKLAKEINNLLTYFEKDPPKAEADQMVNAFKKRLPELKDAEIVEAAIEETPTLKQRLYAASKTAYLETIKVLFPPIGIAITTVKAWNDPHLQP